MKATKTPAITRPLNVRIPSWLPGIEDLTDASGLIPDRLRAVIHQLFLAWLKMKRIEKNKGRRERHRLPDYFPVSAELLKEIASEHYASYIRLLEDKGVVERLRNDTGGTCYLPGSHCSLFRWRIPEHITGAIAFRSEHISDHRTYKSVLKARDNHIKDEVNISSDSAKELAGVFEQLREYANQVVFLPEDAQQVSSNIDELFTEAVIEKNMVWNAVDAFGERYHTQFTTLPKKSRKLIRFAGHEETPLVVLDFVNSQPYFSSIIGCGKLIEELLPEFLSVLPILKNIEMKADYQLYRTLCSEGRLYEFFMKSYGMEKYEVKDQLFRAVLFARKRVYGHDRLFQQSFAASFPSVHRMIKDIRKLNEKELPRLGHIIRPPGKKMKYPGSNQSHKLIPALMQRAESRIVYRHIVPALIAAGVEPMLTVHDSFIILPEYEEKALRIITGAFEKFDVPPPKIKRELL